MSMVFNRNGRILTGPHAHVEESVYVEVGQHAPDESLFSAGSYLLDLFLDRLNPAVPRTKEELKACVLDALDAEDMDDLVAMTMALRKHQKEAE